MKAVLVFPARIARCGLFALGACVGSVVAASGEVEPLFDEQGRPLVDYRIDATFGDAVALRTREGVRWVKVPRGDSAMIARLVAGQYDPAKRPAMAAKPPGNGITLPRGAIQGTEGSGAFVFNPRRSGNAALSVAVESLNAVRERERVREIVISRVPGGDSARELPWDFVKNEIGMMILWFRAGDQSNPENEVISAQIVAEHTPMALLQRIFIRPFLRRDDPR